MRWLGRLINIVAVPRDSGASGDIAKLRQAGAAPFEDPIGTDGAPAMAFTDTMPGYLVAIDRPSRHFSN